MQDIANLTVCRRTLSGVLSHLGDQIDPSQMNVDTFSRLLLHYIDNPNDYKGRRATEHA